MPNQGGPAFLIKVGEISDWHFSGLLSVHLPKAHGICAPGIQVSAFPVETVDVYAGADVDVGDLGVDAVHGNSP